MKTALPQPDRSPARFSPHLDRRRFLRNLGVCLALPAMESFLPRRLMASAPAAGGVTATTATGAPARAYVSRSRCGPIAQPSSDAIRAVASASSSASASASWMSSSTAEAYGRALRVVAMRSTVRRMSARGRHRTFDVGEKPQRPEDPEVRRANLRRERCGPLGPGEHAALMQQHRHRKRLRFPRCGQFSRAPTNVEARLTLRSRTLGNALKLRLSAADHFAGQFLNRRFQRTRRRQLSARGGHFSQLARSRIKLKSDARARRFTRCRFSRRLCSFRFLQEMSVNKRTFFQ